MIETVSSAITKDEGLNISRITVFEIRRGLEVLRRQGQGRSKAIRAELLLRAATVHELNDAVWRIGVEIYVAGQMCIPQIKLSDGDLLIAATAISVERVLLTTDEKLCRNLQVLGYGRHVSLP